MEAKDKCIIDIMIDTEEQKELKKLCEKAEKEMLSLSAFKDGLICFYYRDILNIVDTLVKVSDNVKEIINKTLNLLNKETETVLKSKIMNHLTIINVPNNTQPRLTEAQSSGAVCSRIINITKNFLFSSKGCLEKKISYIQSDSFNEELKNFSNSSKEEIFSKYNEKLLNIITKIKEVEDGEEKLVTVLNEKFKSFLKFKKDEETKRSKKKVKSLTLKNKIFQRQDMFYEFHNDEYNINMFYIDNLLILTQIANYAKNIDVNKEILNLSEKLHFLMNGEPKFSNKEEQRRLETVFEIRTRLQKKINKIEENIKAERKKNKKDNYCNNKNKQKFKEKNTNKQVSPVNHYVENDPKNIKKNLEPEINVENISDTSENSPNKDLIPFKKSDYTPVISNIKELSLKECFIEVINDLDYFNKNNINNRDIYFSSSLREYFKKLNNVKDLKGLTIHHRNHDWMKPFSIVQSNLMSLDKVCHEYVETAIDIRKKTEKELQKDKIITVTDNNQNKEKLKNILKEKIKDINKFNAYFNTYAEQLEKVNLAKKCQDGFFEIVRPLPKISKGNGLIVSGFSQVSKVEQFDTKDLFVSTAKKLGIKIRNVDGDLTPKELFM